MLRSCAVVAGSLAAAAHAQTCLPRWSADFPGPRPPGVVRTFAAFGEPGDLYLGVRAKPGWLARVRNEQLELVSRVSMDPLGASTASILALRPFDDGAGPSLFAGGEFQYAGGVPAANIARWDGTGWHPLGPGLSDVIRELEVFDDGAGPALFAAGYFTGAGSLAAARVARWDGLQWSALAQGLTGGIGGLAGIPSSPVGLCMTVYDDGRGPALYVGGIFTHAGATLANSIARWDGQQWESLGSGMTYSLQQRGAVIALAVHDAGDGPSLYAGGYFSAAGDVAAQSIARWDGAAWHSIPGIGWTVEAIATADFGSGRSLFLAIQGHGELVYELRSGVWAPLGLQSTGFAHPRALFAHDNPRRLWIGGSILLPTLRVLAAWNGAAWSTPVNGGAHSPLSILKVRADQHGPALYAGGSFTSIAGADVGPIARFDGNAWTRVGPDNSLGDSVLDFELHDDGAGLTMYAAGSLMTPAGHARVARLRDGAWHPVGASTFPPQVNSPNILRSYDDGAGPRLYAGGSLYPPAGVLAWDGLAWTAPGLGQPAAPLNAYAMEPFDPGSGSRLYVSHFAGISAWDGSAWTSVAPPGWTGWRGMTSIASGPMRGLYAVINGPDGRVARFDGVSWTVILPNEPPGMSLILEGLHAHDDGSGLAIYLRGAFQPLGAVPARNLARWRPQGWEPVGEGAQAQVRAMATFPPDSPTLWIGGDFLEAGGHSAAHLTRIDGCACAPDCNGDGVLDAADFACFLTRFAAGAPYADCNGDGVLNLADFGCFRISFARGCP